MANPNAKGRWKKGESGNPGGKTKDILLSNTLRVAIRRMVTYKKTPKGETAIVNALPKKHTFADLTVQTLIRSGLAGDIAAIREMFNRLEGTPDANLTVVADSRAAEKPESVRDTLDWLKGVIERETAATAGKSSLH